MPDKLHKTKGIVLRSVKYGETSIIVTIFTELFGVQSYLVNGIRTSSKKAAGNKDAADCPARHAAGCVGRLGRSAIRCRDGDGGRPAAGDRGGQSHSPAV